MEIKKTHSREMNGTKTKIRRDLFITSFFIQKIYKNQED